MANRRAPLVLTLRTVGFSSKTLGLQTPLRTIYRFGLLVPVLSFLLSLVPLNALAETKKAASKPAPKLVKAARTVAAPTKKETPIPSPEGKPAGDAPAAKDPLNGFKQVFQETNAAGSGGPLFIKSDTLELNSKERVFTYKSNVEVIRDDLTITGGKVEGRYDEQNRLETIVCTNNVVITKGEGMRATANRAVYKVAAAVIELTEGPELYREGNALAADKVTIFIDEDRSEAEGNVRVKVIKPEDAPS